MKVCPTHPLAPSHDILQSAAAQQLRQFVGQRRRAWHRARPELVVPDLEPFEAELHRHVLALEREILAEELARYDLDAPQVEVDGVRYHQVLRSGETYLSAAGPVRVERHLYRPAG